MSEDCNGQCSSCGEDCQERKEKTSFLVEGNSESRIKKVIGVVSGKGGVGKSLVTSLLAAAMQKQGKKVAILDADITGPSIPKAFGLKEKAYAIEAGIIPVQSKNGVKIMSLNLMIDHETDPVVWRGPIIAGTVTQFWTDVIWGEIDYMFVDMPPGTGDVPLTVFQSLPLDGIVIVTSPQELVSMIVEKAVNMAKKMDIPILGLVENMSYLCCPDCGKEIAVFGKSRVEELASRYGISSFAKIPIEPSLASTCDAGTIEEVDAIWLTSFLQQL
ncbi:MAG: Mrp/NBP35 family ATP-binding protein [Lachnospiraceae bacterium]